jgi:hypothetical protein
MEECSSSLQRTPDDSQQHGDLPVQRADCRCVLARLLFLRPRLRHGGAQSTTLEPTNLVEQSSGDLPSAWDEKRSDGGADSLQAPPPYHTHRCTSVVELELARTQLSIDVQACMRGLLCTEIEDDTDICLKNIATEHIIRSIACGLIARRPSGGSSRSVRLGARFRLRAER